MVEVAPPFLEARKEEKMFGDGIFVSGCLEEVIEFTKTVGVSG